MLRRTAPLIFICSLAATAAHAQERGRNEVGLLLGGAVTPQLTNSARGGGDIAFGAGVTFQATYGRHLVERSYAELSLEVPLLAAPSVPASSTDKNVPSEYASLFITPGLRVTLAPSGTFSLTNSLTVKKG